MEEYVLTRPGILSSEHSPTRLPRAIRAIPIQSLSYSHPAQSHRSSNPPSHVRPLSQSAPGPGLAPSNVATRTRGSLKLVMHIANALAFAIHYPYRPLRPATRRTSFRGPRVRHIVHHSHYRGTWRREPEIMMEVGSVTLALGYDADAVVLWMRSMDVV